MMRSALAIAAACLVLAACGGGGGGKVSPPVPNSQQPGTSHDPAAVQREAQREALNNALDDAEDLTAALDGDSDDEALEKAGMAIDDLEQRIAEAHLLKESEIEDAEKKLALYRQRYADPGGTDGGMPGTGSMDDPAHHLTTPRFTVHQPRVLEQIGAHHAYARGLTGAGVTIGIEDSIIDWTQTAEFGDRVKLTAAAGADLLIPHPLGDNPGSEISRCRAAGTCVVFRIDSGGDTEALNTEVRRIVSRTGYLSPRDDFAFILDEHYSADDAIERWSRWWEIPTPYGRGDDHGTFVASNAAGANLGVAPGADIVPVVIDFTDDREPVAFVTDILLNLIQALPAADREAFDGLLAQSLKDDYAKFDIINRSYGSKAPPPSLSEDAAVIAQNDAWWNRYLPESLAAERQTDTAAGERTVIVYAAGNESDPRPDRATALPYFVPAVRGHHIAVVATDPRTQRIAAYSDRCGPLPSNWDTQAHGPHFCLAAPGTARGLTPHPASPGRGAITVNEGTSFAAPVVSGSLALLMEHFRGMRGNTEIVKRMLDTADREGDYADARVYGAGHLDLEAALTPVGQMTAGRARVALAGSALATPSAYGNVAQRATSLELAAFDAQEFPFWIPVSDLMTEAAPLRSPIPRIDTPAVQGAPSHALDALGQVWAPLTPVQDDGEDNTEAQWAVGFGPASASVARHAGADGWGYGVNLDGDGHMGARTSGAFGEDLRSGMVWTQRSVERAVSGGLALKATGTLAVSLPRYASNAVFRPTPSAMSAAALRLGTENAGITLEQPLRAESGRGRFSLETGEIEDGRRLRETVSVPLRPDARELRITVRQDMAVAGGTLALSLSAADDAGHVRGRRETTAGIAFRADW